MRAVDPAPCALSTMKGSAGMHVALSKSEIVVPTGNIVRDELLRTDPILIKQFTRATLKGVRFALHSDLEPFWPRPVLKIKEDPAGNGYDSARPALTTGATMSEASQKKALDMVLKSAGVKMAPPLDRFFNFAITRKVNSDLQAKRWKPAP